MPTFLPLAMLAFVLGAQQQPSQNRYKISGTVVNAVTGQPIARALVFANGTAAASVLSGEDGRFEFDALPEGQAQFTAQRPGYMPPFSGPRMLAPVKINASTPSVTIKLSPTGSISGRVLNSDGEPVEGVPVRLTHKSIINGFSVWQMANGTQTDESGNYRLDNLADGSYLVSTSMHPVFGAFGDLVLNDRHLPETYPLTYYPNARERGSAQPIEVRNGGDSQVDFSLAAVPGYKISGTVTSDALASITCEDSYGNPISRPSGFSSRTGEFKITGVPAGPCRLVATVFGPGEMLHGEQLVNVSNADVVGIHLVVQQSPEIPVTVSGDSTFNLQFLNADSANGMQPQFFNGNNGNGSPQSPTVRNALPGTYRVIATPYGNACIGALQSGGTDLLREPLVISPEVTPGSISVTLRSDCGSLSVQLADTASPANAFVLITNGTWYHNLMPIFGQSAVLQNLTPGEYSVYALADAANLEYANPEALKGFTAERVTVTPGEKASVQLKVQGAGGGTQ